MDCIPRAEMDSRLSAGEVLDALRDALIAQSGGRCEIPMPLHLDVPPEQGEVHIKAAWRRGGRHFVVKVASTFPRNAGRGISTSGGMMVLASAETGRPVVLLDDEGYLTDYRTAAAGALVARELGRTDEVLGVLGAGVQARLQILLHREVLPLKKVILWGRAPERVDALRRELSPRIDVVAASDPADVARGSRLIVTATSSRAPLLRADEIRPGTHVSAVGADAQGKQELDPRILERAALLLVDSRAQCARLGELQHAPGQAERAVELGDFFVSPRTVSPEAVTVCDFTGLGIEDLCIAEHVHDRWRRKTP